MQQLDMESDVGEVVNVVNVIPEDQEPTEEQRLGDPVSENGWFKGIYIYIYIDW